MFKKIILASDLLVTKQSEQDSNLRWVGDLLKETIFEAVDINVEIASDYFNKNWNFSRKEFFKKSQIDCDQTKTHFFFEDESISKESLQYLKDSIDEKCLLIGYELSKQTRTIFDKAKINYIDIWLGPVRFLSDLTFALRSNNPKIDKKISDFRLCDEMIKLNARILKVQSYRGFNRQHIVFDENSAIFAGQTLVDKALMKNGKMLNLLDFKDEFSDLCKNHNTLYYARHPFVKSGDEDILAFVRSFRNVKMLDKSGYAIMCDEDIKTVAAITSSFVVEASYFSKETQFFSQPVFGIDESTKERYSLIMQQFLMHTFWQYLLLDQERPDIQPDILGKGRLRDALSFYWSYRDIDKLEHFKSIASKR